MGGRREPVRIHRRRNCRGDETADAADSALVQAKMPGRRSGRGRRVRDCANGQPNPRH
jgi:hypothetical protein